MHNFDFTDKESANELALPISFADFGFDESILKAIEDLGFTQPTEVQRKSFDPLLEGDDLVVLSKTGSGKTAAFGLPLIQILKGGQPGLRGLILLPTRELAKQVHDDLETYSKYTHLKYALVYGGVGMEPQVDAIKTADVLIGTPGRVLDHLRQGTLSLKNIQYLVLDEADRMLDMGFIDDVKDIIKQTPQGRVMLLFSATMPSAIREIAEEMMHDPVMVQCESFVAHHLLKQFYVDCGNRYKLSMVRELIVREKPQLAIVFCATRGLTDAVATYLQSVKIGAEPIHGGLTQAKREHILKGFHEGSVQVLVATDVAARGLDIDDVTHVINYNVPRTPQEYVHRMGRTARAGKEGKVITILSPDEHPDFGKVDGTFTGRIQKMELKGFRPEAVTMPRRIEGGEDRVPHHGGPRRGGPHRGPRRN